MKRLKFILALAIVLSVAYFACREDVNRPDPLPSTGTGAEPRPPVLFEFIVTCDNRYYFTGYDHVLGQIVEKCGCEGAFHFSVGDFDPAENNHALLKSRFGDDVVWCPVLGNHDLGYADLAYIHSYLDNSPAGTVNPGPAGTEKTTYSWDWMNTHFVVLNQYYDGISETGTDGDVSNALYDWLAADLENNTKSLIFVFGHEPAFPKGRHIGDSLDRYTSHRDRFWSLLETHGVMVHFTGHTHRFSIYTPTGSNVTEVSCGQARGEAIGDDCFARVIVREAEVEFQFYRNRTGSGDYCLFPRVFKTIP